MARQATGSWPFLTAENGDELGSDVVLDDNRFLAVRVVENPASGVRYAQVRLWERQTDGGYLQRYSGDQGLTLGPDLVGVYSDQMEGELGRALQEVSAVVSKSPRPGRDPAQATATKTGPRPRVRK